MALKRWYKPVQWLLHLPKWLLGPCWLSLVPLRPTLLPLLPQPPGMSSQDGRGDWNDQGDQGDQVDQRTIELTIDRDLKDQDKSWWKWLQVTQMFDVRMIRLIRMQCEKENQESEEKDLHTVSKSLNWIARNYQGRMKREESEKDLLQMGKPNCFQAGVHVAESESDGQAFYSMKR